MSAVKQEKRPIRKSAVVRIVVWSVVFCLLGLILLAGVTGWMGDGSFFGLPGIHFSLGGFTYDDEHEYSRGNAVVEDRITDLEINWIAGDVTVIPSESDTVSVSENFDGGDEDMRLRWRVKNGKLTVQFCKSAWFGIDREARKDLTVAIPASMLESMNEVEITTVSGGVRFTGNADELTLDAVKGELTLCGDIGELDVHAVEGKVTFTGGVRSAELECVDAAVTMYLDMAAELSFEQVNGDVSLYLSDEITGFSAEVESLGGEIAVEGFDCMDTAGKRNARWGDGSLRVSVEGVDAKLNIKKLTQD